MDWSPERLMKIYPGDRTLPVALFERGFFEQYWTEFDRGRLNQTQLVKEMAIFAGRHYAECWDFMEFIKHTLDDLPATCQLIEELAGRGYRVFSFFEGQVISALEGLVKPDVAIYRLISERYRLVPAETLFIDDLERNIRAAGEWGFQTVHFADREKGIADVRQLLA